MSGSGILAHKRSFEVLYVSHDSFGPNIVKQAGWYLGPLRQLECQKDFSPGCGRLQQCFSRNSLSWIGGRNFTGGIFQVVSNSVQILSL